MLLRPQLLQIARGEDVLITGTFAWTDRTPTIAGWAIKFAVSATPGGTILVEKTLGAGVTIVDATARIVTVALTSEDTDALAAGNYAYDVWRTDSGEHGRLAYGTLKVAERVADL